MQKSEARNILFQAYWSHTVQAENTSRQEAGLPEMTTEEIEGQFATLLAKASERPYAVILNADVVREELTEVVANHHGMSEGRAEAIKQLSDEEICEVLDDVLDDHFWGMFDEYRRAAIAQLDAELPDE